MKSYNLKHKIALIKQYKKGNIHLLDIGAGTGDFVLSSKKYAHWEAMGIEPSEKARAKAEEKGLLLQVDFSELLPHSFDVITMWHVLEHVPDVTKEIQIISNLLKENGIAVIAVPNSPKRVSSSFSLKKVSSSSLPTLCSLMPST